MVTGGRVQSRAYAKAGGIATEALFAMRTIAALGLERVFVDKYSNNLAPARNVTISARCKLGLATGILFSAFIILQAAGFIYGGFRYADELERSSYEYTINDTITPMPGMPGVDVTLHYCALANNTPSNVSLGVPCAEVGQKPLMMNCYMAHVMSMFDQSDIEVFGTNLSMLEIFRGLMGRDAYPLDRAGADLREGEPFILDCSVDGAIIIITVMFVMQGAIALGQVAQPLQQITAAIPAANTLSQSSSACLRSTRSIPAVRSSLQSVATSKSSDVIFAYPSAPEHNVCNGYTLSIKAGQTVALSGASGSGKSTIIQLIERFYDPLEGSITLDNVDIKTLNVKWLRSQLGLVSQEPVLFQGTVADNIATASPATRLRRRSRRRRRMPTRTPSSRSAE